MKITQREKVLLAALLVIAVLAVSYYFVISPSLAKYNKLQDESLQVMDEAEELRLKLAAYEQLKSNLDELSGEIKLESVRFYPEILQPRLFMTLHDLVAASGFRVHTISFNRRSGASASGHYLEQSAIPAEVNNQESDEEANGDEQANDSFVELSGDNNLDYLVDRYHRLNQTDSDQTSDSDLLLPDMELLTQALTDVEVLTINFDFTATYNQIMQFVDLLEKENRHIQINNISYSGLVADAAGEEAEVVDPSAEEEEDEDAETETPIVPTEPDQSEDDDLIQGLISADGLISGSMSIDFYAVPKIFEQDQQYTAWP